MEIEIEICNGKGSTLRNIDDVQGFFLIEAGELLDGIGTEHQQNPRKRKEKKNSKTDRRDVSQTYFTFDFEERKQKKTTHKT